MLMDFDRKQWMDSLPPIGTSIRIPPIGYVPKVYPPLEEYLKGMGRLAESWKDIEILSEEQECQLSFEERRKGYYVYKLGKIHIMRALSDADVAKRKKQEKKKKNYNGFFSRNYRRLIGQFFQ